MTAAALVFACLAVMFMAADTMIRRVRRRRPDYGSIHRMEYDLGVRSQPQTREEVHATIVELNERFDGDRNPWPGWARDEYRSLLEQMDDLNEREYRLQEIERWRREAEFRTQANLAMSYRASHHLKDMLSPAERKQIDLLDARARAMKALGARRAS